MPDSETVVHSFEKNGREEVRARLTTFKGRNYVDLRIFVENDEGECVPTKKGVSVHASLVPELAKAVAALEQAYRDGAYERLEDAA